MKKAEELSELISNMINKAYSDLQDRPNQYVVAYYRQKDDSLIGYHASSFCQITKDILQGKRYSGENPSEQLKTISKNLEYTLNPKSWEGLFGELSKEIAENDFESLSFSDIYINAIYLEEGTPKHIRNTTIIDPKDLKDE